MKASQMLSSLLNPSVQHHAWHIANTNQYWWDELISFYWLKAIFTKVYSSEHAFCKVLYKKKKKRKDFPIWEIPQTAYYFHYTPQPISVLKVPRSPDREACELILKLVIPYFSVYFNLGPFPSTPNFTLLISLETSRAGLHLSEY